MTSPSREELILTLESELGKAVEKLWGDVRRLESENEKVKRENLRLSSQLMLWDVTKSEQLVPSASLVESPSKNKASEMKEKFDRERAGWTRERGEWDEERRNFQVERCRLEKGIEDLRSSVMAAQRDTRDWRDRAEKAENRLRRVDEEFERERSIHNKQKQQWSEELALWAGARGRGLFSPPNRVGGSPPLKSPMKGNPVVGWEADNFKERFTIEEWEAKHKKVENEAEELRNEISMLKTILKLKEGPTDNSVRSQGKTDATTSTDHLPEDTEIRVPSMFETIVETDCPSPAMIATLSSELEFIKKERESLLEWKKEASEILSLQKDTLSQVAHKYRRALMYADVLSKRLKAVTIQQTELKTSSSESHTDD